MTELATREATAEGWWSGCDTIITLSNSVVGARERNRTVCDGIGWGCREDFSGRDEIRSTRSGNLARKSLLFLVVDSRSSREWEFRLGRLSIRWRRGIQHDRVMLLDVSCARGVSCGVF